MKNIFTYGSLMFAPVWGNIVTGDYQQSSAKLPGYLRQQVKKAEYPAIVSWPGSSVVGVVYFNVSGLDLKRLDEFEGAIYQRDSVEVKMENGETVSAQAYVLRARYRHLLSSFDWSPEEFEKHRIKPFLKRTLGLFR